MIRVLGGVDDPATRLENRIGEPAANPYLYMASQILSGLDGVDRELDPGPSADTPYETKAALLPKTLQDAVLALKDDPFFREALGAGFVDYYVHIKNAESSAFRPKCRTGKQREYSRCFEGSHSVIPGWSEGPDLRCAIAHRGTSRFRVRAARAPE